MSRFAASLVRIMDKFDTETPRSSRDVMSEIWVSGELYSIALGPETSFNDVIDTFVIDRILEKREGGLVLTEFGVKQKDLFKQRAKGLEKSEPPVFHA